MSNTINRDRNLLFALGKMTARRRFCVFLHDVSARMALSGYSGTDFRLCMSRTDIANYLCLAIETVSRLFTQLQAEGIIKVDGRNLQILDMEGLLRNEISMVGGTTTIFAGAKAPIEMCRREETGSKYLRKTVG